MNSYDLSRTIDTALNMGRVQTIATTYCLPGDRIGFNWQCLSRMAPLRQPLQHKVKLDYHAFFIPMSHVLTNWNEAVEDNDHTKLLAAETGFVTSNPLGGGSGSNRNLELEYLGTSHHSQPRWKAEMYNLIYNHYIRHKVLTPEVTLADQLQTGTNKFRFEPHHWQFGAIAQNMQTMQTRLDFNYPSDSEFQVALASGNVDLRDVVEARGDLELELKDIYQNPLYRQKIKQLWGGYANEFVDKRPLLLASKSVWQDGRDVDGTSDGNLGQFTGKSASVHSFAMSRKFIPLHGFLWIVCVPRWPFIHKDAVTYYDGEQVNLRTQKGLQDYLLHPQIVSRERPHQVQTDNYFHTQSGAANNVIGHRPYAFWHREEPNRAHFSYTDIDRGFPIVDTAPTELDGAHLIYCPVDSWSTAFQSSSQLGHIRLQGSMGMNRMSSVPEENQSYFAPVND